MIAESELWACSLARPQLTFSDHVPLRVADGHKPAHRPKTSEEDSLYIFGVIAARTTTVGATTSNGTRSTRYVTPFGLMRETSLSREAVEAAVACLKRAGLVEVLVDNEHGYESWRISEAALAAASTGSGVLARSRST